MNVSNILYAISASSLMIGTFHLTFILGHQGGRYLQRKPIDLALDRKRMKMTIFLFSLSGMVYLVDYTLFPSAYHL